MLLNQFPDLTWLKQKISSQFTDRQGWEGRTLKQDGWPSVILNVKTKSIYRDHVVGPISLFANISGESSVKVGNKDVIIPSGYFFISNAGQDYTLEVNKQSETCNIHFGTHFSQEASKALGVDGLDNKKNSSLEFRNRLFPINETSKSLMHSLRRGKGEMHEEEILFQLLEVLVKEEHKITQATLILSSLKKSTKDEIMNRLLASVDYMYSNSSQKISLEDLATVSCLSKFHYLRLFKEAFNQSPHHFINKVKSEQALPLLSKQMSVREVAHALGFQSPSSFSRMFYQTMGCYPTQVPIS